MSIPIVVTDIEGTTTPIAFVKRVLFPYARSRIAAFVRQHAADAEVRAQLNEICRLENRELDAEAAGVVLQRWIDEDRKLGPLKALQGMIWRRGYLDGELIGQVYADAACYLRRWREQGRRLYVYSSGSVEAQRLLFAHSDHGDLSTLFSGYFDTRIGGKQEVDSYRRLLAELKVTGEDAVFLSDVVAELDAARAAGFNTCQLVRAQDGTLPAPGHPQARDFGEVPV